MTKKNYKTGDTITVYKAGEQIQGMVIAEDFHPRFGKMILTEVERNQEFSHLSDFFNSDKYRHLLRPGYGYFWTKL